MFGEFDIIQDRMQEGQCDDDRGEQADEHANAEGDGEPLHNAGTKRITEDEQDDAGDEGGDIGIADGVPGPGPAQVNGLAEGAAGADLFLQPFEDEDVRIHGHADAQDEAGNTGQGEHYRDELEQHQAYEGVDDQGQV